MGLVSHVKFTLGEATLHQLHTPLGKVRAAPRQRRVAAPQNAADVSPPSVSPRQPAAGGRPGAPPAPPLRVLAHVRVAAASPPRAAAAAQLFAMGEVALELFQETPTAFLQELRAGKYLKSVTSDRDVLMAVAELGLPVESSISAGGITLLPPSTVETLLIDKRQLNLVQPFRLALLKLASQARRARAPAAPAPPPARARPRPPFPHYFFSEPQRPLLDDIYNMIIRF